MDLGINLGGDATSVPLSIDLGDTNILDLDTSLSDPSITLTSDVDLLEESGLGFIDLDLSCVELPSCSPASGNDGSLLSTLPTPEHLLPAIADHGLSTITADTMSFLNFDVGLDQDHGGGIHTGQPIDIALAGLNDGNAAAAVTAASSQLLGLTIGLAPWH